MIEQVSTFLSDFIFTKPDRPIVKWDSTPRVEGVPLVIDFEDVLVDREMSALSLISDEYKAKSFMNYIQNRSITHIPTKLQRNNYWLSTSGRKELINLQSNPDVIRCAPVFSPVFNFVMSLERLEYPYIIRCDSVCDFKHHPLFKILSPLNIVTNRSAYNFTLSAIEDEHTMVLLPRSWHKNIESFQNFF